MFLLKKVLTPFLLPPGIFIIFLIIAGAWLLYKKNWKAGIVTLILGCFMWALSIAPVSDAMVARLESEYNKPKDAKGDVIILLGAPPAGYLFRFLTAARLQKSLDIPIIVSGAKSLKHNDKKSNIFKKLLVELGVPLEKIIVENKSRDTYENGKFSHEICAKFGFFNPILVTSAYHMKRAIMSFERTDLKVLPFPAGFKSWKGKQYKWNAYLPGNYLTASIAIKEYLGLLFYKIIYQDLH
jgi:uncharacterized SAM-binding protein YcdF (DUF218 family)